MRDFMYVAKALADESRVRALLALRNHELCVCQIVELLGLAPSTVSKHMSALKQAYLVECRRSGRWVYYRRTDGDAPAAAREALEWVDSALARDTTIRDDAKRLRKILKVPVEELCATESAR